MAHTVPSMGPTTPIMAILPGMPGAVAIMAAFTVGDSAVLGPITAAAMVVRAAREEEVPMARPVAHRGR